MTRRYENGVAIIGAGVAGLACARRLREAGERVSVFDKGRGPGGRMSSRRTEVGRFNHGAQFFTARSDGFRDALADWLGAGVAAEWRARFVTIANGAVTEDTPAEPRFVGAPSMNAIIAHEGKAAGARFGVRVAVPVRDDEGWRLSSEEKEDLGRFDAVVIATPAEQAVDLLAAAPALAAEARAARSAPCWALMLGFDAPLETPFDAARVVDGPIAWIAREASKPGREAGERLVVHARADWSAAHLEADPNDIAAHLIGQVRDLLGAPEPVFASAHRWWFAQVVAGAGEPFAWDAERRIGACGDWRLGARVEAAWTSGDALGRALSG